MAASDFSGPLRHHQRGAAAVFAAISIIMGLVCLGLAVDLGYFYYTQRNLQRMTNLAALDAARVTGGCLGLVSNPGSAANTEVIESVTRNGGKAEWVGSGVRVGSLAGDYSVRYFNPVMQDKNRAVDVKLTRPMPNRLIPLFASTSGAQTMSATAAAYSRPRARVSIGSKLVNINPPLLNSLIGKEFGPVNLNLVSYQNLFGANLPITAILDRLGVGTPEQIITSSVPVNSLLQALTGALGDTGQTGAAQAAEVIRSSSTAAGQVIPGDVLGIGEMGDFAADSVVNAGETLLALGALATGNALLDLPITLPPPLGPGSVQTRLIMPATPGSLSPDTDTSSDASYVHNSQGNVLVNLPLTVLGAQVTGLSLFVQVAQARARVSRIACQRRGLAEDAVWVIARAGISRIGIGRFNDINSSTPTILPASVLDTTSITVPLLGKLPVKLTITIKGDIAIQSTEKEMPVFLGPFDEDGVTQSLDNHNPAGQLTNALAQLPATLDVQVTADLLGIPLSPIINAVLAPLLATVKSTVISQILALLANGNLVDQLLIPVMQPLGLTIGTADVTVYDVVAEEPYLFTH